MRTKQQTLEESVEIQGVGLFFGAPVGLRCLPAEPNTGIRFVRIDLPGRPEVPALADYVAAPQRYTALNNSKAEYLNKYVGFVESVVSRMIPVVPEKIKMKDPLIVMSEEYGILPVSKKGFTGEVPVIKGIIPYDNLQAYEEQKIFVHNLGHAICAYFGFLKGYEYIWEAVTDPEIKDKVQSALDESGTALIRKHNFTLGEMTEHIKDLLERFANSALGDTVYRVGRDPIRKLGPRDRLVGAAKLCLEHNITPKNIVKGIYACLKYNYPEDAQAKELQSMLLNKGIKYVINNICKLGNDEKLSGMIINEWRSQNE